MNTHVGERYQCSDPNCGCEIEITAPCRMGENSTAGSQRSQSTGGSGLSPADDTKVGSLRNAEAQSISTPGDYGSQGATGEGIFGTSGGNQRTTASGRLGSTTATSGSRSQGSTDVGRDFGSEQSFGSGVTNFSCCCGKTMYKSSTSGQSIARAARA
jgi:hypothetical protein